PLLWPGWRGCRLHRRRLGGDRGRPPAAGEVVSGSLRPGRRADLPAGGLRRHPRLAALPALGGRGELAALAGSRVPGPPDADARPARPGRRAVGRGERAQQPDPRPAPALWLDVRAAGAAPPLLRRQLADAAG